MSIAEKSLMFCSMFEGELLVVLMLRYWGHPLAEDEAFRQELMDKAYDALRDSIDGQECIQGLPPSEMNFVAAVWYVESMHLQQAASEIASQELQQRQDWVGKLRASTPSCFCDQEDLLD